MTSTPGNPFSDLSRVNRRDFLRRAAVLGVSASAVGAFLAACGAGSPTATTAPASAAPASSAAGSGAPSAAASPTSVLGTTASAAPSAASNAAATPAGGATPGASPTRPAASASSAATPSAAGSSTTIISSKSGFKGTLQYWVLGYQPNGANQTGKLMDAATGAFTKANPDIKVETTGYTGDQAGFTKLTQAVQGGGAVDMFRLPSDLLPLLVQDNLVAPIDDYLTADDKADIYPSLLETVRVKGKAYSWPLWVPPVGMYMNLDVFKEKGVTPPTGPLTYEQFVDIAKQLTFTRANGDKVYGYSGGIDPGLVNTWPFIIGDGALPIAPDNTKYTWNTPDGYSGLKKLVDLALVHKVTPPDFGSVTVADLATAFTKGLLAMYSEPSGSSAGYRASNLNFDVRAMPIGKTSRPVTAGGIGLISVAALTDKTKLTAAMDLGRYLTSAQVNTDVPGFYLAPGARKSVKVADPIDKFTPLVDSCYITPIIAEWPQIRTIIHPYIQNAVFGKTSVEDAMNGPQKEIDGILAARK
jgi:multiple sugar transport system substrate-binding protein